MNGQVKLERKQEQIERAWLEHSWYDEHECDERCFTGFGSIDNPLAGPPKISYAKRLWQRKNEMQMSNG